MQARIVRQRLPERRDISDETQPIEGKKAALSPVARAEVKRILDGAARRILGERLRDES